MALNKIGLVSGLTKALSTSKSANEAAKQIASAYHDYAKQAIAKGSTSCPVVAEGRPDTISNALAIVMSSKKTTGKAIEDALFEGVKKYWSGVEFEADGVKVVAGGVVLGSVAAVHGTLSTMASSSQKAAERLGQGLHTATSSAIVTFDDGSTGSLM